MCRILFKKRIGGRKAPTVSRIQSLLWAAGVLAAILLLGWVNPVFSELLRGNQEVLEGKEFLITEEERRQRLEEICRLKWDFVKVPGGTFEMGDVFGEGNVDEIPIHKVTLSEFWIGKYEVTQAQWKAVMGSNPSRYVGDDLPVENMTWEEVQEFIRRLNFLTGMKYRLPTEAEWEYAARSGGKKERYSGSDNVDEVAWHFLNSGRPGPRPVGTKAPNGLGIHDMSGNVWEWCSDWYGLDYYSKSPSVNPLGPSRGAHRVVRGGRWGYFAESSRCTNRYNDLLLGCVWADALGFRLGRSE